MLRGNGTNELIGLFNRSGGQAINTYTRLGTDDNTVALARVIDNTRGSSFLEPDRSSCTRELAHHEAAPTERAARSASTTAAARSRCVRRRRLRPGVHRHAVGQAGGASTVVGAGTALVGSFGQGAHIWRRGGGVGRGDELACRLVRKDLTAIRAESRLALGL